MSLELSANTSAHGLPRYLRYVKLLVQKPRSLVCAGRWSWAAKPSVTRTTSSSKVSMASNSNTLHGASQNVTRASSGRSRNSISSSMDSRKESLLAAAASRMFSGVLRHSMVKGCTMCSSLGPATSILDTVDRIQLKRRLRDSWTLEMSQHPDFSVSREIDRCIRCGGDGGVGEWNVGAP
ncbi:hypothetical protein H257_09919 [Aphanomyces astaci]|uniref:Uncharacterized protein n=1 Tax=Aphanomyces astaci TaxID=112090 RepID=W4G9J9_APHAT|nr:hypothetical protein H257_09919 [Aphanomyces astaci]ETV75961.1 hypothetical protein H257_09919 [Aphanomyces astaci]|eukprot:XP_009834603.1 hypothetical protein H257_09919 [Aphanomyces astaci]